MLPKRFLNIVGGISLFFYILQPIFVYSNPLIEGEVETQLLEIQADSNKTPDLLETLLMISKHWDPTLNLPTLRQKSENLVFSAKSKMQGVNDPDKIIQILRTVIHENGGYQYTDQVDEKGVPKNPEELFLHGLLQSQKGYCMNLSLLYLIIGQKLELPLYGVALPNHFFVRFSDGKTNINIETTERGVSFPDTFYQQRFGALAGSKNPYFMKNLDARQTLGAYFSNVGMVYYQNQKPERAVFYLELSTRINPKSIDAQNNLANIYSELKKPQDAIKHYNLALKADPGNSSTLFNLGLVLQETGDSANAINAYLQVVQIEPGFSTAHQMLANLYLQDNRLTSALLHLKILVQIQPRNLQNHLNIAKTYMRLKQQSLSVETLKKVQNLFPNNPEIDEGLAEAYYKMGDYQEAILQYRSLIDRDQTLLRNYIQLGWTYYRLNDLPMASAWTLRGMNKSKEDVRLKSLAQMNLGFFSLLQKQYDPAKKWYEKVFSGNPPGIAQGMIRDIDGVLAENSNRADLQFFKGWIYFKGQQPGKSQVFLQNYLKVEQSGPFSEEARHLLKLQSSKNGGVEKTLSQSMNKPKDMVLVPAGFFIMGANRSLEDEAPEHRVYLDAYWVDKYEVSAEEFAKFLNTVDNVKGYYLDNKFGTLHFDGRFHPRSGLGSFPINNITWHAANEYCKWKDKKLPTEAEWEKAARGTTALAYPWGNGPPSDQLARYFQIRTEDDKYNVMVPVQALPKGKSPYGLHNMAGNVKEWVDDWYDREYYKEQSEYANPRGPIGGEFKVVRGGSWRDLKGFIYSSFRNSGNPKSRMDDYGFRCAKNADPDSEEKKLTNRVVPRNKG